MTRLRSVPLGLRADGGVRPYHALSKVSTGVAGLPAGAPCHRRLAYGGSPFAPALISASLEMTRLSTIPLGLRADGGVRPYHALSKVSTGVAGLPAGVPCHRRLARRGSLPSPTCLRRLAVRSRLGLAFARDDETKFRLAKLAAGRGRPALPMREAILQTNICPQLFV